MLKRLASAGVAATAGMTAAGLTGAGIAAAEPAEDGFYLRAGAGATFVRELDQTFAYNPNLAFAGTPPAGQIVETDPGFLASFAAGFDYADGIRTELEYRYATAGVSAVKPYGGLPNPPQSAPEADLHGHFVFSNFYYDFRNKSPLTPFVGLGVGGAFVDIDGGERDAALAYQGRAGASWAFNDGFFADIEYVYARTNTLRYGPDPEEFGADGPFETAIDGDNFESSSIILSLRRQF